MTRTRPLSILLAIVPVAGAGGWSTAPQVPTAAWTREFRSSIWVVNTSVSAEYGVRRSSNELERGVTTLQSVESIVPALLVLEGAPERGTTLSALHPEDGRLLWQKTGLRLRTARPFGTYSAVNGTRGDAYYAQIVGHSVLLWITNAKGSDLSTCSRSDGLVAFALDDGAAMVAIDSRTGGTRWHLDLPLENGSAWMRFMTWATALGSPAHARPAIHRDGRRLVLVGESSRIGPMVRFADQARILMLDLASGARQWEAPVSLPGRHSALSWAFGRENLFVTTGREAAAYELASGRRVWSTPSENAFELRVASAGERDVVLLERGATKWWTPERRYGGHGLTALNGATGEVLWRVGDGYALHSYDPSSASALVSRDRVGPSMYFATGTGGDARLVSVTASTGRETTIGRFAWPPGENLLDQFHGRTYTVVGERLSAYTFDTDAAARALVRVAADMQAGIESLERAIALARSSQLDIATREATHGIGVLEALTSRGVGPDDELVVRRPLGDWFATSLETSIGDRARAAERAIIEYEKAIALLATASNPGLQGLKQEFETRLQAVRNKASE